MKAAGFPTVRLRADAARALGLEARELRPAPARAGVAKVEWGPVKHFHPASVPLARLYVLSAEEVGCPEIRPLRGAAALAALVRHTYRRAFVADGPDRRAHLQRCATVARRVPLFRLVRPARRCSLELVIDTVERELAR